MAEATRLGYGLCFRPLDPAGIEQEQQFLKAYIVNELSHPPREDTLKTGEIFKLACLYFGPRFENWLDLNREGRRAGLARHIRLWLNGGVSDRAVFHALSRDISLLHTGGVNLAQPGRVETTLPTRTTGYGNEGMLDFFTLLGPVWIAKLLLSLDGKV